MNDKANATQRRSWEPMAVTPVGRVPDVIRLGGGKMSCPGGDPGEPRKQQPHA